MKYIQIFYGKSGHDLGGINVKIKRLEQFFPNNRQNFDIIYTVDDRVPLSTIRKAKEKGVRIIQNFGGIYHQPYKRNYQKYNAPIIEIHNKLADYVFYQSEFSRNAAHHFCKNIREESEILYNAVDTELFTPKLNKKFGYNILTAGFFCFKSRLEPIIYALPQVIEKYPQSKLIIAGKLGAGNGEFDVAYHIPKLIKKLKVSDHVIIPGAYKQEQACEIYNQANVFVHAKYKDWCPNVVIEAMACGLPIIFNNTGGVKELVGNCGYGVDSEDDEWHLEKVPPLNPKKLAEKIILGIENQKELGKKSRQKAQENFDLKKWIEKHKVVYKKVLEN